VCFACAGSPYLLERESRDEWRPEARISAEIQVLRGGGASEFQVNGSCLNFFLPSVCGETRWSTTGLTKDMTFTLNMGIKGNHNVL
jgi:hypothetical protein